MRNNPIIVQKYGGACLETPAKIRAVASSLADLHSRGHRVVAIVSAMGSLERSDGSATVDEGVSQILAHSLAAWDGSDDRTRRHPISRNGLPSATGRASKWSPAS
ncbi:amino acid kinase family protein [Bradyrhizobium sp. AZCC 2289]|uniref:amino acid kinase family protein n=1 Tax=Bradyrhizobium sp. AZCC 2289 TaxID=3117026 RepID=UPI002FF0CA85